MSPSKPADQAAAVAAALAELGVRPGERVLIMLPGGRNFVNVFIGAMRRGAVPLAVNPGLPAADVTAIAEETGARLIVVSADRLIVVSAERIHGLTDLQAEPPVQVAQVGEVQPQGLWVAALRRR